MALHLPSLAALTLASALVAATPALAVEVRGTFQGIAHATSQSGPVAWDGAALTGRFRVEIPRGPWWDPGAGHLPPSAELAFDVGGLPFSFLAGPDCPDDPGMISLGGSGGPAQSLSFLTNPRPRFQGASLTFGSADGSLYREDDFANTLTVDGRTVSWMGASFADGRSGVVVSVDVQSFQFADVAAPVDEPATAALLAAGAALVALGRRRRGGPPAG